MAAGDIFKLVLNSRAGSEELANVFHYRQTIGVLGGEQLASSWIIEVLDEIRDISSVLITFTDVQWVNYNDPVDFGIDDSINGLAGIQVGEMLPVFNAWGFQYNRESRITRNGAKRFAGISEAQQNSGVVVPSFLPAVEACADSLGQLINFGGSEWWEPVIARIPPGATAPTLVNGVKNVTYKRITSQNSRKSWG